MLGYRKLKLLVIAAALGASACAKEEVPFIFEPGSVRYILELYGIIDPTVGSMTFVVEAGEGKVTLRIRGIPPSLDDVKDKTVLHRMAYIIGNGTGRVSAASAILFRQKYLFGRAVYEDKLIHGASETAERFGIPEERVGQWVESYLSVLDGVFKPFPPLAPSTETRQHGRHGAVIAPRGPYFYSRPPSPPPSSNSASLTFGPPGLPSSGFCPVCL